ncbi:MULTISPECIES: VOC family protein [Exiguobacterium]|uniref:VOC family protein n=1 Tax=Exiguobacterium TaxID=33986 RepID=UPI000877A839|nr:MULTISPECIES: VOC family protein [Exiguobacterium]TCI39244.1 ring-cleaving dioxygenase [Exiguobacterium sp. SH4S7]TCI48072.1 ring-cleaving dioxygenase [Exiguobacterium sp. SH5S32]TCI54956.1 ring-cleaving dioxygenase [Exiguobacterium sp. SH1S4]TCI62967.1 ring-cleaving dioxygenase [Exiguobacterium sp. SH0S2]TCI74751.1 ring-cleaving dioxygenase [Exiguobacterium sp. SH1S1]
MTTHSAGIHHISAMVKDPQRTLDFYGNVLGIRFIKQTVNFDDPGTYHLYFGDETGTPGTVITFFPIPGIGKGSVGSGQVGVTAYLVPVGSLLFWEARLREHGVATVATERFGEPSLLFEDPDGLVVELVARASAKQTDWLVPGITKQEAITGFAGATLLSKDPEATVRLLTELFGFTKTGEDSEWVRLEGEADYGNVIDVKKAVLPNGVPGAGTVHHIAWRIADGDEYTTWQDAIFDRGLRPTEVRERHYFRSVYFHDEGRILHELATDAPGFLVDETIDELGSALKLPDWLEVDRDKITRTLPTITIPRGDRI